MANIIMNNKTRMYAAVMLRMGSAPALDLDVIDTRDEMVPSLSRRNIRNRLRKVIQYSDTPIESGNGIRITSTMKGMTASASITKRPCLTYRHTRRVESSTCTGNSGK
eukprot:362300-Chlamydomonas_euryale.AAC.1